MSSNADLAASAPLLLDSLTTVVSAAAAAILKTCAGTLAVKTKADLSPVTAADEAAEAVLIEGLARVLPGVPIVSEEAAGRTAPAALPDRFLLVDPLDGTRELVAGRDEFTINVALITRGDPCLGIVAAPARALIWRGVEGAGADRLQLVAGATASAARHQTTIRTRPCPRSGLIAAVSRSHLDSRTEAFLSGLPIAERRTSGSAIKFCQLAEGAVDVYPRLATTCEWDVAAGHAIVAAAGGVVSTAQGTSLSYGGTRANFRVPQFVAWGDPAAPKRFGQHDTGQRIGDR